MPHRYFKGANILLSMISAITSMSALNTSRQMLTSMQGQQFLLHKVGGLCCCLVASLWCTAVAFPLVCVSPGAALVPWCAFWVPSGPCCNCLVSQLFSVLSSLLPHLTDWYLCIIYCFSTLTVLFICVQWLCLKPSLIRKS